MLFGLRFVAGLGVARSEQDRRVAMSRCQAFDRLQHARLGNGQHRQVDALRQFVDRFHAGAAADLVAAATDEVQSALVAEALRLACTNPPNARGSAEAPTMAMELGSRTRPRDRAGSSEPGAIALMRKTFEGKEAGKARRSR